MKKILIGTAIVLGLGVVCGFVFYKYYMATLVADAIMTQEELPSFVPPKLKTKITKYKAPINDAATEFIRKMHQSPVTIDQVIEAIDNASEAQVYAMLDEVNNTKITNTNQFFDLAKKHFPANFDVEVFREPFTHRVDMKLVKKGIRFANTQREAESMSVDMAREVAKKILLQKEKEYKSTMGYD